ncbi:MAG: hypothetical protein OSJ53_05090 [Kineothrix sp.]|jgi:hypothetical protein|nr:hypothetical protein [Lachnospiraceae bacterium]MCX4343251.1 hypothetical protein [Kineothrix sp.]
METSMAGRERRGLSRHAGFHTPSKTDFHENTLQWLNIGYKSATINSGFL